MGDPVCVPEPPAAEFRFPLGQLKAADTRRVNPPEDQSAAFYCVADERYFLGAVGLVNSLRLVGHREPIYLLDCGLTEAQRTRLDAEVDFLAGPGDVPPWLLKTIAPLKRPAEVMVLLDTDMVATRTLAPLIEQAKSGRLVAFRNPIQRYCPEWGELFGVRIPRRQPYVSSAAVCVERGLGVEVLGLMEDRQKEINFDLTHWRRNVRGYPFTYADQDILNAILATVVNQDRVVALEARLAPTPPFTGLRLVDEGVLRCAYRDGVEPYLVHHHTTKPWLEATHDGVYSRLLRRLLIADDLSVRVPESQVPLRLRRGLRASAERKRINARESFRYRVRDPLTARLKRAQR